MDKKKHRSFLGYFRTQYREGILRNRANVTDVTFVQQLRFAQGLNILIQLPQSTVLMSLVVLMLGSPFILLAFITRTWTGISVAECLLYPFFSVSVIYFLYFSLQRPEIIRQRVLATIDKTFEKGLDQLEIISTKRSDVPYPKLTAGFLSLRYGRTLEITRLLVLALLGYFGILLFLMSFFPVTENLATYHRPLLGLYIFANNVLGGALDLFGFYQRFDLAGLPVLPKVLIWSSAGISAALMSRFIKHANSLSLSDMPEKVQTYMIDPLPKETQTYLRAVY